jgi:5-methylcytosine-specific restriction protein A
MRAAVDPKGIIASGRAASDWYVRPHYLDRTWTENANDVSWDTFAHPDRPILLLDQLLSIKNQRAGLWLSAASGVRIPDGAAKKLESAWRKAVAREDVSQRLEVLDPNEVPSDTYPEGATKRITVNAYERSEAARQACIDHYGTECRVCKLDFVKRYGKIGKGFIHVHHLAQLSEVGGTYRVDPVADLRPVCPNCHSMLHRRQPPMTIRELEGDAQTLTPYASLGIRTGHVRIRFG